VRRAKTITLDGRAYSWRRILELRRIVRKHLERVPIQTFNTPRGTLRVSTPEAIALDLVGYHHRVGGLDQVATILSELAERIDPQKLAAAARNAPLPWAQRLGHLLEHVAAGETAAALNEYVGETARQTVLLLPGAPRDQGRRNSRWKVLINARVEAEL
jgi:predicted transcriptional regulator of viral defense system